MDDKEFADAICGIIVDREAQWGPSNWRDWMDRAAFYHGLLCLFEEKPFREVAVQAKVIDFIKKRRVDVIERLIGPGFKEQLLAVIAKHDELI
jgi:hypothetical protein